MNCFLFIWTFVTGFCCCAWIIMIRERIDYPRASHILSITAILWIAFLLSGCVHEQVTVPSGPGGAISAVDQGGVYFTSQGHLLWIKEGVPPELFTLTPRGWYMTNLAWHQGMAIRMKGFNP